MADEVIKISELPSGVALTGAEKVPMVQDGTTIEATSQEIADLNLGLINSKQNRINGIVSGCTITVETFSGVGTNKRVRVTNGTWYITPSEYTKATDTVSSEITLCVTGGDFKYYDVVADNTGAITIYEGTPNTSPTHYVIDTATEVLLGYVLVGDSVIETPTPVVSGFIPYDEKDGEVYHSNTEGFGVGYKQGTANGKVSFTGGEAIITKVESSYNSDIEKATVEAIADQSGDSAINWSITSSIRNVGAYLTTQAFRLYNVALNYAPSVTLPSSINPALGATYSNNVTITGNTTITGFDNVAEGITRVAKFTGILQLTYNATSLILPSSANITTAVGDIAVFRSLGSGNWECIEYTRRDGTALVGGSSLTQASQAQVEAAFDNTDQSTPTALEQTSVLTPFNTWWLVQKIKTWVRAGFTLTGALNFAPSVNLPSSTNPALGATNSNNVTITGTTTITGFDTVAEGITRIVKFSGILQLTYNATSLILPTSANITTAVGDIAVFRSLGGGNWECMLYGRKDGTSLAGGSFQTLATEVTGSLTAAVDKYYINTASATYTDPTGVQGKGFIVLVRSGTATVGGTAYTSGVVYRYYNSGAWSNIMLRDFATITGDITFTAGVGTIANNAVTNAKAATMPANTIKANNTGSTANASDITPDQFTAMMEIAVAVGTTGIITGMTSATYKYIRLTSASTTGLGSIVAPSSSYKDLYIWNDTGVTLTLYHDYSSETTAYNRILCGANRSWANNTMLHLKYDVTESRWCTVVQDGNTFRSLLAGTGTRLVAATSTGQEEAIIQTLDIDFSGAQQTSATTASWTGVNEVNIAGLLQGQLYIDVSGGYRYECHRNDYCSRTPIINVETFTTNSLYPVLEITGTSGTLAEDSAYVLNNASQVVMTLPTAGTFGLVIIVHAKGAGGGRINTSATQQIVGTSGTQPTAGQDISFPQHSAITLKCTTGHATNAIWAIQSVNPATTITII